MASKVKKLKTEFGPISLLKSNPRQMSGAAYHTLSESVEAKPYMLNMRGIVAWRSPEVCRPWTRWGRTGRSAGRRIRPPRAST